MRHDGAHGQVVHDEGYRLGSMSRRLERLQPYLAELDDVAVAQRVHLVLGPGGVPEVDGGADAIAQLEVTGDEVGVEMRQEHVGDAKAALVSEREVLIDVTLRIHDGGDAGLLVAHEVGRMRQALQVELLKDHR